MALFSYQSLAIPGSTSEEARRAKRVIPEGDVLQARQFMREALRDAQIGRRQRGGRPTVGAVIVDPNIGVVVASASQERQHVVAENMSRFPELDSPTQDHPLHHSTMLCISCVGRALVAGKAKARGPNCEEATAKGSVEEVAHGNAHERASPVSKAQETTAELKGSSAERAAGEEAVDDVHNVVDGGNKGAESGMGVNVLGTSQYLCTGFDLYITREPGLM